MQKITSYLYRKIIGLILVSLTVICLVIPTIIHLDGTGKSLWQSIFMADLTNDGRINIIILSVLILLGIVFSLGAIPSILRKGKRGHYVCQAFTSIAIIGALIFNRIANLYNIIQIIISVVALVINLCASAYYVLCIIYNYDEMYFVPEIIYEDQVPPVEEETKSE